MKFQKSLTPRLTDVGPVNYSALSDGSVTKIPMKSSHGSLPRNSTMLKISFPTFIPLIPTNPDPYLVYNLLPKFPIHSTIFFLKPSLSLIFYLTSDLSSDPSAFSRKQENFIYKQFFTNNFLLYHFVLHFRFLFSICIRIPFFLRLLRLLRIPPFLHHLLNPLQAHRNLLQDQVH